MDMTIPFRLREKDGAVHVEYGINEEPRRWGNTLLGLTVPLDGVESEEVGKGFPICRATVTFAGEGYASAMAWIQILRFSGASNGVLVDQPPQLEGTGMPYVYWGPCPSFFDNPFTTTRGVHWTADAFLVASPDAVMTRVVQPICGFSWGYSTEEAETRALPLVSIAPAAWPAACAILRPQYPDWQFLDEWVTG
ncbi:MAG TPA: hypothetical protein VFX24_09780 [Ktedonobacterales bacterium]|jgi:hypothetical protein|nr:hypothetical protein [Ktedonobacterales bacterium]